MARLDVVLARAGALAWLAVAASACDRTTTGPQSSLVEASPDAEPPPAPPSAVLVPPTTPATDAQVEAAAAGHGTPPPAGEAERKTIHGLEDDPILVPHLARLRAHFGDAFHGPFLLQRAGLTDGRVAVLVSLAPDESDPIVLVIAHDVLAWAKDRPTGGITPPVRGLALVPHPNGGAVLFAYVPAVATVAGRIWDDDGGAFAELQVLAARACDAVSAAYSPGVGWLVVASHVGGARAQLVRESGTMAWADGIDVGMPWHRAAPVGIGVDSPTSFVLVQLATTGAGSNDRLVALRYGTTGAPLWPSFRDLGPTGVVGRGHERPVVKVTPEGTVRVKTDDGVLPSRAPIEVPP